MVWSMVWSMVWRASATSEPPAATVSTEWWIRLRIGLAAGLGRGAELEEARLRLQRVHDLWAGLRASA